jgi:HEAT repeat protein
MFNHEIFAVSFARTVDLVRTRAPLQQQKSSLRAVYALTSLASAMMRVYEGLLSVDDVGIPDNLPFVPALVRQMQGHAVAEIAIAKGATPAELLALVRGLAAEAPESGGGVMRIKEMLRDAGSKAIMVIPLQPAEPETVRRAPSVTQAFEMSAIEEAAAAAEPRPAAPVAGSAPTEVEPEKSALAPGESDSALQLSETGERLIMFDEEVLAEAPPAAGSNAAAAPPGSVAEAAGGAEVEATPVVEEYRPDVLSSETPLGAALQAVARDPYGRGILDRLSDLAALTLEALKQDRVQAALHAMSAIIAWEPEAPEGSPKNSYGIVIRRMLTRDVLALVAQYVADPRLSSEATRIMQRARTDGAEVLLGLLATSETIRERKAYMLALKGMPEGVAQVIHMLHHHQWFVVRNVAELMGEARIEESVGELGRLLSHHEARVRKAAAVALAKIGTAATVEPLRRALKEGNAELKALVAGSIVGREARALAMPLVALAEGEENHDVLKEYYRALGRIGTPDAVQALIKAGEPGGRLLGRRPTAPRLAAVEGLRLAGGNLAAAALEKLSDDGDKAVREAARRAVGEVKARAGSN